MFDWHHFICDLAKNMFCTARHLVYSNTPLLSCHSFPMFFSFCCHMIDIEYRRINRYGLVCWSSTALAIIFHHAFGLWPFSCFLVLTRVLSDLLWKIILKNTSNKHSGWHWDNQTQPNQKDTFQDWVGGCRRSRHPFKWGNWSLAVRRTSQQYCTKTIQVKFMYHK